MIVRCHCHKGVRADLGSNALLSSNALQCFRPSKKFSMKFAWCAVAALCCVSSLLAATKSAPPKIVLWSWSAHEDLRFLKEDADVGVAYLALSLRFEGRAEVVPEPRLIPLRIASNTWQMVVVRCYYEGQDAGQRPAFSDRQRQLAARMIAEIASVTHAQAIQIDFDAPQSAYAFYRQLLRDVRARLGPNIFLSMTALVSWCQTPQSWLAALPVDEIVPMAFSMGQATPAITTMLQRGGNFAFAGCRDSIGVQFGYGTPIRPRKNQRVYFFAQPQIWSPDTVRAARGLLP